MKKRKVEHSSSSYSADMTSQNGQLLAAEMYNSGMFKLQLDELLAEVQPRYVKRMVPIENALRKLKAVIERIPDREPVDVCTFFPRSRAILIGILRQSKRRRSYINATRLQFRSRVLALPKTSSTNWHIQDRRMSILLVATP
jgi:hypothetical protein